MNDVVLNVGSDWNQWLACPRCRGRLTSFGRGLSCERCRVEFPVADGVPAFADIDAFYEDEGFVATGSDFADTPIGRAKLYFARHHYLHEIVRSVSAGSRIVELGCGGGSRFLARRYRMLGVDLSTMSVRRARQVYDSVVRANCTRLPLGDGTVDAVVSSFVLEHLEGDAFEHFFQEMHRVLRPGGRMVHYFDVANTAPFTRWAERQPWYHALFIAERGHHGLRPLTDWATAFAANGFVTLRRRGSCKTWLQDVSIWGRLADPRVPGMANWAGRTMRGFSRTLGRTGDALMALYQDAVEPLYPDAWASKVVWVVEKPADGHRGGETGSDSAENRI